MATRSRRRRFCAAEARKSAAVMSVASRSQCDIRPAGGGGTCAEGAVQYGVHAGVVGAEQLGGGSLAAPQRGGGGAASAPDQPAGHHACSALLPTHPPIHPPAVSSAMLLSGGRLPSGRRTTCEREGGRVVLQPSGMGCRAHQEATCTHVQDPGPAVPHYPLQPSRWRGSTAGWRCTRSGPPSQRGHHAGGTCQGHEGSGRSRGRWRCRKCCCTRCISDAVLTRQLRPSAPREPSDLPPWTGTAHTAGRTCCM